MVHQELRRTLTLWDGMALAIGSIAGSGILYLPSLTYVLTGHDVLFVWLGGTLLCLPLLFMFTDMVRLIPDGSGMEGFIARGLGSHVAATVPLLFLSVVVLGIPAGVLVAGEYLRSAIGGGCTGNPCRGNYHKPSRCSRRSARSTACELGTTHRGRYSLCSQLSRRTPWLQCGNPSIRRFWIDPAWHGCYLLGLRRLREPHLRRW
jgi:amino acid transporter